MESLVTRPRPVERWSWHFDPRVLHQSQHCQLNLCYYDLHFLSNPAPHIHFCHGPRIQALSAWLDCSHVSTHHVLISRLLSINSPCAWPAQGSF